MRTRRIDPWSVDEDKIVVRRPQTIERAVEFVGHDLSDFRILSLPLLRPLRDGSLLIGLEDAHALTSFLCRHRKRHAKSAFAAAALLGDQGNDLHFWAPS